METACDFEHSIEAQEATPDMRVNASVAVQETEGTAVSGRMTLRARCWIFRRKRLKPPGRSW